jgi:asparagine synthase (glutamine-hydrolysing)
MPGIVGILGVGNHDQRAVDLRRMVDAMLHEPTYSKGVYIDAAVGVYLGWVAHPGSFADCLPVWSEARDVCLIFAGEDFSDDGEVVQPGGTGDQQQTARTTYLVRRYLESGPSFLEGLNGCFSGVIVDLRQRVVVLFNDRFGFHRVYYHERATGFYFSSEAKSLLGVLPELRQIDAAALGEVFSCGCALDWKTLFRGVSLLPGAASWTYRPGSAIDKRSYFSSSAWEQKPELAGAAYCQRFKETFERILPRYLRPDNGLAMSLTGGLDGRMIMAWANARPGSLPCYTFGGEYRDCADVRIARRLAELCGQRHQTLTIGRAFCADFPALAEKSVYVSDGAMDVTGSVEIYANRLARDIAPIRLTGNYGSEIVRGYVAFRPRFPDPQLLNDDFLPLVRSAEATYEASRQGHEVSFVAFKQVPWHHYGRFSVEQSQLTPRSPYLDNELVALMYQAPAALRHSAEPSLRLIAKGSERLAALPTDRGIVEAPRSILDECRRYATALSVKAEYAYDYGMPQWLAAVDHALVVLHFERLFLGRHKFAHFRIWYRDRLARYVQEILLDPRSLARPYLNGKNLEAMVSQHVSGARNHTSAIHQALTAELVHRLLVER